MCQHATPVVYEYVTYSCILSVESSATLTGKLARNILGFNLMAPTWPCNL